ncbi:MAG: DUF6048 family protein [Flavobacteriaceae bacterium]|jgi:hypothetical protein|nr:DUF6048 family protein [Flavobacteriaceae bacterium]
MKTKPIFTLFFSFLFILNFGQKIDSASAKPRKYTPNFTVGVDVLNVGLSFFSDRKVYQGFVSSKIGKRLHAVAEAGFEKNIYEKNGYDVDANGIFLKLGAFYMLAQDAENVFNGFYAGGKLAGSTYNQEYFAIPVRGFGGGDFTVAFPKSSQSSYWLEAAIGGRVQLFDSKFFIDVNIQPKYLIYTTKQENIFPMIVPGFGKSSTKFNLGFAWSLAYKF